MKKFYSLIFFIAITFFARAQESKSSDINFSDGFRAKVVKMFPNPAVDVINFEFLRPVQKDHTLQVFNFIGKKILELTVSSQKLSVPLTDFYRGVYIFQLRDKTGRIVESGKFQVNR